jgi:type III polyketide synthase
MFNKMLPVFEKSVNGLRLSADNFDWAVHPTGASIIAAVQEVMGLSDEHLRATKEIYRTKGNTSSATVLIVLDKLRWMGVGRDNVVATSWGPGIAIEMAMMRRCWGRDQDE